MENLRGNVALLVTPFKYNKEIDFDAYSEYVEWQAMQNPSGLFTVCGSSEMKWLNLKERIALIKCTKKFSSKIPVIATGNLEKENKYHKDEIKEITDLGVNGIVIVPPKNIKLNSTQHFDYLSTLKENSDVPLILYEWPQLKNYLIDPVFYNKLVKNNIVLGIKDTTCNINDIKLKNTNPEISIVYQANMPFLLESLEAGITSVMAIVSTVESKKVSKIIQNFVDKRYLSKNLHFFLVHLDFLLRSCYPSSAKYLLNKKGLNFNEYTRWPNKINSEIRKSVDLCLHNEKIFI